MPINPSQGPVGPLYGGNFEPVPSQFLPDEAGYLEELPGGAPFGHATVPVPVIAQPQPPTRRARIFLQVGRILEALDQLEGILEPEQEIVDVDPVDNLNTAAEIMRQNAVQMNRLIQRMTARFQVEENGYPTPRGFAAGAVGIGQAPASQPPPTVGSGSPQGSPPTAPGTPVAEPSAGPVPPV